MRFSRNAIILASAFVMFAACDNVRTTEGRPVCNTTVHNDPAGNPTVQVFAVGFKEDVAATRTYEDYRKQMEAAVAKVAPCFSGTIPTLVVFPENTALVAAFIGSRGERARTKTDSVAAFAEFFQTYKTPLEFYRKTYPDAPGVRKLLLAMTDTLGRAIEETFPPLAKKHGIYLAIDVDVAEYEATNDPALVKTLGDPDLPGLKSAYIAKSSEVYNVSIVYGPDGSEIGRVRKAYLTPPEENDLQLSYGSLEQLRPIETPFGKLAPVISKDGWMPDVLERFNELGADITLQHEAFSGWAIEEHKGDWLPDVMLESVWSHVQSYSSIRYGVLPCITGNLLNLVFDCQSAITKEVSEGDTLMGFIGQEFRRGFLKIGEWAIPDPIESDPQLTIERRRAALREHGETLKPGGKNDNGYAVSVAAAGLYLPGSGKLDFPERKKSDAPDLEGAPLANGVKSVKIAGDGKTENMTAPDIAFDGTAYHLLWHADEQGQKSIQYARVSAGMAAAHATIPFTGKRPYAARITATADKVYAVAVQDGGTGEFSRLMMAASDDHGDTWYSVAVTWNELGAGSRWNPAIAAAGDNVYVAWTDRRAGASDIYIAVSRDKGANFTVRRLDEEHTDEDIRNTPANTRNNQALPSVSAYGDRVIVIWSDFRDYSWDVYGTDSTDAGRTWRANKRVNPAAPQSGTVETERILGASSVAISSLGEFAAFDGVDNRGPDRTVRFVGSFTAPDPLCLAPCVPESLAPASYRPHVTSTLDGFGAVWQQLGPDGNDLFFSRSTPQGWGTPSKLVEGAGQQFNPRTGGNAFVWEDWRSGHAQIGFALVP